MVTKAVVASILFIHLAGLSHQDTTLCSDRVQVCPPSASPFGDCICGVFNPPYCSWVSFADSYKRLSDVSSAPLLMWNKSMGYGQYMCIRLGEDNLTADHHEDHHRQNVVKTILILPEAQRTSCDGCITTRICRATTGEYLMQFSMLFDRSLLAGGDCELYFTHTNRTLDFNGTISEGDCVKLLPSYNYSILCPICYADPRDIYYEISIPNYIENCSNSDTCNSQPTMAITATAAIISTMIAITSTETVATYITTATPFTTITITPTNNMSDVSNDDDDEYDVGIIIGVVVIAVAIITILIIICIGFIRKMCYQKINIRTSIHRSLSAQCNDLKEEDKMLMGECNTANVPTPTDHKSFQPTVGEDEMDGRMCNTESVPTQINHGGFQSVGPTFIVYSKEHSEVVLELSDFLQSCCGINCDIDRYNMDKNIPDWGLWIENKIKELANCNGFVLLICTYEMHQQLSKPHVSPRIEMKAGHIGTLALNSLISDQATTHCIIPVCACGKVENVSREVVPTSLRERTIYSISRFQELVDPKADVKSNLNKPGLESLRSLVYRLRGVSEISRPPLGQSIQT